MSTGTMNRMTRIRVTLLVLTVAIMAAGVGYRLYVLQFVRSHQLHARAEDQHTAERMIKGKRGAILDRHGRELAVSLDCGSLYVHPRRVRDPEKAAALLAGPLKTGRTRLMRLFGKDENFLYLGRGLDPETVKAIRRTGLLEGDRPAFGIDSEGKRFYPGGRLASHVVGFAGTDQKGLSGIERARQKQLQGGPVSILAVRDGRGQELVEQYLSPSKTHRDISLTIDLMLQHIAERELGHAMRETGARSAAAVLIDPRTGEVLALANRPAPDLNSFGSSRTDHQRNRATIDIYEPGSTFKIITAAAVLDQKAVHPGKRFDCEGGRYRVADRTYTDHDPFDILTFRQIIEHSSNIGMIKIAHCISGDVLLDYVRKFGLGDVTRIGLPEQNGKLPRLDRSPLVAHSSLAIGYGINVTAVQMASAIAAVANEGVLIPPRIVRATRGPGEQWQPEPAAEPRRVISADAAETLTRMLEGVVLRGTGSKARIEGYRVAGKTGTARKHIEGKGYSTKHYYASFGGFAPAHKPSLALLVVLDSPRGNLYYGGQTAAPVFARIMRASLEALRVPPDDGALIVRNTGGTGLSEPMTTDKRPAAATTGLVPDVRHLSLREAAGRLAEAGYFVRVSGHGVPFAQSPLPGTRLPVGKTCTLRLAERAGAGS